MERQIRGARALDTEALCIEPGLRVWSLRWDVHVLDDGGNALDAGCIAAIAALLHFRRADVSVKGRDVIVHSYTERAPVPLAVHHIPVCVTLACFEDPATRLSSVTVAGLGSYQAPGARAAPDAVLVVDPTDREELVADGSITFTMNAHKELCGVHKLGACGISKANLLSAAGIAGELAAAIVSGMKTALADAEAVCARQAVESHAIQATGYDVVSDKGIIPLSIGGAVVAPTTGAPRKPLHVADEITEALRTTTLVEDTARAVGAVDATLELDYARQEE